MSTGSPASERGDTRFSTPVPELDDHRLQAPSLPRADTNGARDTRRGTGRNGSIDQPVLLQVNEALRGPATVPRDFEHVIVDDDRSGNLDPLSPHARRSSNAHSPTVPRRSANRSARERDRSRDSSSSSSSSPPNSVEAFADPRRRERANTLDSRAPSDVDLSHTRQRAYSGATQQRRPTISNASLVRVDTRRCDNDGPPEDDVCFPPLDDTGKTYTIDFEELEEFVALCAQGQIASAVHHGARRQSTGSRHEKPKIFHDLRHHHVPRIVMTSASPHREPLQYVPSSDSEAHKSSDDGEKLSLRETRSEPTEPERFCLFSSELKDLQRASHLGGLVGNGMTFRDLFELPPDGGGVWWLDVENPTKDELVAIGKAFRVHPLTVEDIETQEAREKVELFHQYYFVTFRTFIMDKNHEDFLDPINLYVVVFRDGLLTVSYSAQPHCHNVRRRIAKMSDYLSLGADWICYALIDDIVDSFGPVIRDAERESEDIEDQVFIARQDDYAALLRQIGASRKRVLNMMRLLGGKADVIKGFAKRCNEQFSAAPRADIGLYLGDIQDHVVTMMSNLGHVEKMLSRSHGNYLAQLNVDGLMRGNHTNNVLSKITLVATILVPLNLICGLFGMNVPVPGKNADGLGWFFGILGVIAAIVVVSLVAARKLRAI
jgi:magnesium transporter